jgi:hypothetical protein
VNDPRLDDLRARGAGAADPVRLRFIEAMARRAEGFDGAARQVLDTRLAQLIETFQQALATAPAPATEGTPPAAARTAAAPTPSPLSELLGRLGHAGAAAQHAAAHSLPGTPRPTLAAPPELKALRAFRGTWQRLAADQRLTQALAKVPDNAGPLHSHHLVHRALTLMRDTSPEYLQHFMAQVDALMWLEQAQAAKAPPSPPAPPSPA